MWGGGGTPARPVPSFQVGHHDAGERMTFVPTLTLPHSATLCDPPPSSTSTLAVLDEQELSRLWPEDGTNQRPCVPL
jgi:hypothetical protein